MILKGSFNRGSIRDLQGYYNMGALVGRIGFWGPLYYSYNIWNPQIWPPHV